MTLDLSALDQAIRQLAAGLGRAQKDSSDELVRDGVIQRFEYTYELSHKMLKRYLEQTEASPEQLDQLSFQDLIRLGAERGLLAHGWDVWRGYRIARGTTSHVYDRAKAEEVFEQIPGFLDEARHLIGELKARSTG